MEKYVAKVFARATIKRRYGAYLRTATVTDGRRRRRRRRRACGTYEGIKMPIWARTQWAVLHELAHVICLRKYHQDAAYHGWEWAAIYVDLVRFMLGAEAAKALTTSFRAAKVRWKVKRKVVVTQATLDRLAAARAVAGAARGCEKGD